MTNDERNESDVCARCSSRKTEVHFVPGFPVAICLKCDGVRGTLCGGTRSGKTPYSGLPLRPQDRKASDEN